MKITVLAENNSRVNNYLLSEHGLCLLIEEQDQKILFDTGHSDVFLKNASKMNISLDNITDIVLSHSHDDHTGGLKYLKPDKNIRITAHPNVFDEKYEQDGTYYGCPLKQEVLDEGFSLNLTKKPFYITDKLLFLGGIENNISDDIDDSALVYIIENELFIITGCSHSGIINIVNYAQKVTGINKIYGILGGFHLVDMSDDEIEQISQFFKSENIEYLAPCHCCDLKSKILLAKNNDIKEICTGDTITVG